jgi:hypothetical protein
MAHMQQQVLDAFVAALKAGDTRARDSVYPDLGDPLKEAQLSAIVVLEGDAGEVTQADQTIHGLDRRTLNLEAHCIQKRSNDASAQARQFGLEAEKAIKARATAESQALRALCKGGVRMVSSRFYLAGEGSLLLAARVQSWQLVYFVKPAAPDVAA